jgi:hypothetical protein
MVDDPRAPIEKVQAVQFADSRAVTAPFIYFDDVLTAGVHQVIFASNSVPAPPIRRRMVRPKRFMS